MFLIALSFLAGILSLNMFTQLPGISIYLACSVLTVGWYLGRKNVRDELSNKGELKGKFIGTFMIIVKFIAPIAITMAFIYGLGLLGRT